ncbi:MAG: glutamate--cysteine ligase [Candidatus Nanopelagicales bacterium]
MHVDFTPSGVPTLGVEVEYGIVSKETGRLTEVADELLGIVGQGHPDNDHPKAKHELFNSSIEIITGVCDTPDDAVADLKATHLELKPLLDERGLALESSGTHPYAVWDRMNLSPGERYQWLLDEIGWPARRLAIHGVHFHVGVRSKEKAIMFIDSMLNFLPQMLALSTSSPYWLGDDTGLASIRSKIFEIMPTSGLPPWMADWASFERFMTALINAETIKSVKEVWWDIRPHPTYGTVEIRMCDGIPTLREVRAIAALAQALIVWMDQQVDAGNPLPDMPSWVARENKWRAARYGLDGRVMLDTDGRTQSFAENITQMVDMLEPVAAGLGTLDALTSVREILEVGSSANRQRAVVAHGGSLQDVVTLLREELAADLT